MRSSVFEPDLPVIGVLPALHDALADAGSAVLVAPPGSGKTTRVPLALLDAPWRAGRRIVMLEPRRLAARAAASWMASLLNERVGDTVGYRVRADTRVGRNTRIEVVTEGVLTRMLQSDPTLDGVAVVLFDEFHERSVHADLGLALCLQSRALLRADLRLLVMSATLDPQPVAALLGDAPVIEAAGRIFPVETHYRTRTLDGHHEGAVAGSVRRALLEHEGDVLVFLPGFAEIRRVQRLLLDDALSPDVDVLPLHGSLPLAEQDRAIRPAPAGRRKVVLATAIAETSLTIEGVRVVIDAGWSRVPRFSPRTGLMRLATVRVSKASAEQRRGRAGRVAPGHCFRLWTEAEHAALLERNVPEILETDLVPLVLELALWGAEAHALDWLDAPPPAALAQARELLCALDALDAEGRITTHGRAVANLGVHPRLAHMLLEARDLAATGTAADLAALLDERDVIHRREGTADPDVGLRLDALDALRRRVRVPDDVDVATLRRVLVSSRRLAGNAQSRRDAAGLLLAFAYPDRIALARPDTRGRFILRNGRGVAMDAGFSLAGEEMIVAAVVEGHGREGRILLAAPVAREAIEAHFASHIETQERVTWDDRAQSVRVVRRRMLGALVLAEASVTDQDAERVARVLLGAIRHHGLAVLPWSAEANRLIERIRFARALDGGWPDATAQALLDSMEDWLLPHLGGMRRLEDLRRLDLVALLTEWLGWERRRALDALAPTHVVVPTGSRLPIDYSDPDTPALAVRLQEMFGTAEGPRIAHGRVPLTLHLLSPAQRPVQVTRDLAGFWKGSYHAVRKDLRGRYPKHFWPEDPLAAEPTRRAKPRQ